MKFNGKYLKNLRQKRGLTQRELAAKLVLEGLKTSPQSVEQWESGKCEPRTKSVYALAKVFNIPMEAFLI